MMEIIDGNETCQLPEPLITHYLNKCYICENDLHLFMITPILENADGILVQCCKKCADKICPEWNDEDDNGE